MIVCDVVICYYNNFEYLPVAIDSILNQNTEYTIKLHLVDDCSEDVPEHAAIKEKYKSQNNVFWYKTTERVGPHRAMNGVFVFCKGDFLAVQDSDDISCPYRIQYSIDKMAEKGIDVYSGSM